MFRRVGSGQDVRDCQDHHRYSEHCLLLLGLGKINQLLIQFNTVRARNIYKQYKL